MFTVIKVPTNSSEVRNRLDLPPDVLQARVMDGNMIVFVAETWLEDADMLDVIVDEFLSRHAA
jgi:hypothetical protein